MDIEVGREYSKPGGATKRVDAVNGDKITFTVTAKTKGRGQVGKQYTTSKDVFETWLSKELKVGQPAKDVTCSAPDGPVEAESAGAAH